MVMRRGGLGRGLESLIPRGPAGVTEIPVDRIRPNPRQPRHRTDPTALAELADSIREHGVIQPIVVARAPDGDGHVLIAGERRWQAATQAGLSRIPAVVKDVTHQQMLELALVENVQRSDLNPLEEAAAYQQLIDEFGLTQEEVARRVGRRRPTIANSVRLLGLPETVRAALAEGEITEGHARALLGAADEVELIAAYREVVGRGLNVRQTEELVRSRRSPAEPALPPPAPSPTPDPERQRIEEMFRVALGTKVELQRRGEGGRLVIHFYNDEGLQAIYEALTRP
jgi:ParB family transcriptional regulator, chromosome partitioning protein